MSESQDVLKDCVITIAGSAWVIGKWPGGLISVLNYPTAVRQDEVIKIQSRQGEPLYVCACTTTVAEISKHEGTTANLPALANKRLIDIMEEGAVYNHLFEKI